MDTKPLYMRASCHTTERLSDDYTTMIMKGDTNSARGLFRRHKGFRGRQSETNIFCEKRESLGMVQGC